VVRSDLQYKSSALGGAPATPDAPKVWEFFGDYAAQSSDELVLMMALVRAPDGSGHKIAAVAMCHCGDLAKGEQAAAAIRGAATPLVDMLGPLPYPVQNTLLDPGFPKDARNYWKSAYFKEITADTVSVMVERFTQTPSIMTGMVIEHFHGAVTRVPPTATAFPHREPGCNLVITGVWPNAKDDDANIAWVKDTFGALAPYTSDSVYMNYLAGDDTAWAQAAYGPCWDRLRQVKRRYDPENVFHLNQNVTPA
jgi:FAD/FMN-containing dehydrogenase